VATPDKPMPTLHVDFNEMVDRDLVLLSAQDAIIDANGVEVILQEGMLVQIFDHDEDEMGPNNLIAKGVVELNRADDWSSHVKWCCRIDRNGIRHEIERRD
jgi:hypothetical protein